MTVEGAYIYKGITVELYDQWFDNQGPYEDQAFYSQFMTKNDGKILEIGSGTGRLLLQYLREGYDIEGVEPSEQMIGVCKEKASHASLEPVIHKQFMQRLNIPQDYSVIFIPMCTYQFLVQRVDAFESLRRFYLHLQKGGKLIISLYVPKGSPGDSSEQGLWYVRRSTTRSHDQAQVVLLESTQRNYFEQIETKWIKYDIYKDSNLEQSHMRTMHLRWYHQFEFIMMLEKIGFTNVQVFGDYTNQEVNDKNDIFVYIAQK
jgi:SAM-dependent methyltransferase